MPFIVHPAHISELEHYCKQQQDFEQSVFHESFWDTIFPFDNKRYNYEAKENQTKYVFCYGRAGCTKVIYKFDPSIFFNLYQTAVNELNPINSEIGMTTI